MSKWLLDLFHGHLAGCLCTLKWCYTNLNTRGSSTMWHCCPQLIKETSIIILAYLFTILDQILTLAVTFEKKKKTLKPY